MKSTLERVQTVVAEVMTVNPQRILPDTDIVSELGPDSLEQVEIVIGLETEFDISLDETASNGAGEYGQSFGTVRELVNRIDTMLESRKEGVRMM